MGLQVVLERLRHLSSRKAKRYAARLRLQGMESALSHSLHRLMQLQQSQETEEAESQEEDTQDEWERNCCDPQSLLSTPPEGWAGTSSPSLTPSSSSSSSPHQTPTPSEGEEDFLSLLEEEEEEEEEVVPPRGCTSAAGCKGRGHPGLPHSAEEEEEEEDQWSWSPLSALSSPAGPQPLSPPCPAAAVGEEENEDDKEEGQWRQDAAPAQLERGGWVPGKDGEEEMPSPIGLTLVEREMLRTTLPGVEAWPLSQTQARVSHIQAHPRQQHGPVGGVDSTSVQARLQHLLDRIEDQRQHQWNTSVESLEGSPGGPQGVESPQEGATWSSPALCPPKHAVGCHSLVERLQWRLQESEAMRVQVMESLRRR